MEPPIRGRCSVTSRPSQSRASRRSPVGGGTGSGLGIHLRMRKQDAAAFDLAVLAEATDGFSWVELEQVIVSSLYRSLHEQQQLTTGLLLQEVAQTAPLSVSRREDIERIREAARGRFVPVA